jgi:hypothetical protein
MAEEKMIGDHLRMATFEIIGRTEAFEMVEVETAVYNDTPKKKESVKVKKDISSEIVARLNNRADEIAEKIELELKKRMPPYIYVQANVQFNQGSIDLIVTATFLSWVGSIVFDAAKGELENQLANWVKNGVQRVINKIFTEANFSGTVQPIRLSANRMPPSSNTLFVAPEQSNLDQISAVPTETSTAPIETAANSRPQTLFTSKWLLAAMAFTLLVQILIIFDRFFAIRRK